MQVKSSAFPSLSDIEQQFCLEILHPTHTNIFVNQTDSNIWILTPPGKWLNILVPGRYPDRDNIDKSHQGPANILQHIVFIYLLRAQFNRMVFTKKQNKYGWLLFLNLNFYIANPTSNVFQF